MIREILGILRGNFGTTCFFGLKAKETNEAQVPTDVELEREEREEKKRRRENLEREIEKNLKRKEGNCNRTCNNLSCHKTSFLHNENKEDYL